MASTLQVLFDGTPAGEDFYTTYASLEVEENADLPGAFQLLFPVSRSADGDLTGVADARFKPLANLAVVATPEGKADECIFDGHVLAHKLHLERGATNGMLTVWGQDASWLMNLKEKVREWVDMTDSAVAAAIFGDYGISPADDNAVDDSASHPESGHTLMQRASDIQFLRMLARRNGKLCRVACKDKPATSRRSRPRSVSNARRRRGCTTTRPGTAATRPSRPPGSRRSATASRDSRSLREHP